MIDTTPTVPALLTRLVAEREEKILAAAVHAFQTLTEREAYGTLAQIRALRLLLSDLDMLQRKTKE